MNRQHHRLRIPERSRLDILRSFNDVCIDAINHIQNCSACTDDGLCPDGQIHYEKFIEVQARREQMIGSDNEKSQTERPEEQG